MKNKFLLFILVAAALILIAVAFFLLPDNPPLEESRYLVNPPVFSHTSGFYQDAVTLVLSSEAGTVIRYTLDGSTPTLDSPVYEGPLELLPSEDVMLMNIATTSDELYPDWGYDKYQWMPPRGSWKRHPVVQAAAFNEAGESSPVVGHTYLIEDSPQPILLAAGQNQTSLPTIFLITDADGLFSEENGIYVTGGIYDAWRSENPDIPVLGNAPANFTQRGSEWERPAHITFVEPDGTTAFSQHIGIRIHGGFTRAWTQKTLRLYARSEYDENNWFNYPVFGAHQRSCDQTPMTHYKRLLLRSSGNDMSMTLFRDALMHQLAGELNADVQAARPAVVYINGEYWGIHQIRERLDDYYLSEHYHINRDELVLINERGWEVEVGQIGDVEEFQLHMRRITGPVANEAERFELASTMMDMEHWIDYLSAQLYAANTDWIENNMRVWRKRTPAYEPGAPVGHDGRWRWIFFDLDFAFDFLGYGYQTHNTVEWLGEQSDLFEKLSRSDAFRDKFAGRFADLMNTTFRTSHVQQEADYFTRLLAPEMPRNIDRWPNFGDMIQWHREIQVIHDYAADRPDFIREHVANYFNLPGTVHFSAGVPPAHQGTLRVNTLMPGTVLQFRDQDNIFRGKLFQGIPVELEATPAAGWQFSHWDGLPGQPGETLVSVTPDGPLHVRPVFVPSN
jgi:hypothetical protein